MERVAYLSLILFLTAGCWKPAGFGVGGRYIEACDQFVGRGGDFDKAAANLEYIAARDPFYKDTLTLLGRSYYNQRRYEDAFKILKRALSVNSRDEIAWIMLGLAQLRLGDDKNGMESLKGGITLLSQAMSNGYKGIEDWDVRSEVKSSLRKAVLSVTKGLGEKDVILRNGEVLLRRIDNELSAAKIDEQVEKRSPGP